MRRTGLSITAALVFSVLLASTACGGKPPRQPEEAGGGFANAEASTSADPAASREAAPSVAEPGESSPKAKPPKVDSGDEAPWIKARRLIREGKIEEAERQILDILDTDPTSSMAWHLAALAWASRGDYARAMDAFDRAMFQAAPKDMVFLRQKAEILKRAGKGEEAVLVFEEALRQQPDDPQMQATMAVLLLDQGKDLERAESLAAKAAAGKPEEPAYWETLGIIQQTRGRDVEAVISLHRLIKLDPDSPKARKLLLKSLEQLNPETVSRLVESGRPKR